MLFSPPVSFKRHTYLSYSHCVPVILFISLILTLFPVLLFIQLNNSSSRYFGVIKVECFIADLLIGFMPFPGNQNHISLFALAMAKDSLLAVCDTVIVGAFYPSFHIS